MRPGDDLWGRKPRRPVTCPALADWPDADHWLFRTPPVGAWRAADAAMTPKEPM